MIPGHTKFKCDGSFGLIKKLYRKTTVDCVNHIVEVVKRSSTAGLNKAQCVLGTFFKKLNGLQKYQHFVFEAANPGIVKAQMVANGPFVEFNLVKTKRTDISQVIKEIKAVSILVLTPPPLDYKRQEYLYHNIRPFIRDEFKDITCPRPIYTGNE